MAHQRGWQFAVAIGVGLAYALFYLVAIGDLSWGGPSAWGWMGVAQDPAHALRARGPFLFEAIGILEAGTFTYLFSPVNLLIGLGLAALLAVNLLGALALYAQPDECRRSSGAGAVGGALPAMLAGGACCAPSLLLLLGIPGLGAFIGVFAWLVPLSIVLLIASRWWQRRLGAPPLLKVF